ncbi:MAG: hypothetical protein K9N52_04755 [Verrucomicrobia bacterium]|nr:hypothetical protein [Verrucomicrobiota bacterium]
MEDDISRSYAIFGLDSDATADEVEAAYAELKSAWSPERFEKFPRLRGKAARRLAEVEEAYKTICADMARAGGEGVEEVASERNAVGELKRGWKDWASAVRDPVVAGLVFFMIIILGIAVSKTSCTVEEGAGKEADILEAPGFQMTKLTSDAGAGWALYNLAIDYLQGNGVVVDTVKAADLFLEGAAMRNPHALNNLGICYLKGVGRRIDKPRAVWLIRQAAAYGLGVAQVNLGYFYENGVGVDADMKGAYKCYALSVESGITNAVAAMQRVKAGMSEEDIRILEGEVSGFQPLPAPGAHAEFILPVFEFYRSMLDESWFLDDGDGFGIERLVPDDSAPLPERLGE